MKGYKLHSEDHQSFIIAHPDGSQFMVAKHALDDDMIEKIRKMPPVKMADGGVVPGNDASLFNNFSDNSSKPDDGLGGPWQYQSNSDPLASSTKDYYAAHPEQTPMPARPDEAAGPAAPAPDFFGKQTQAYYAAHPDQAKDTGISVSPASSSAPGETPKLPGDRAPADSGAAPTAGNPSGVPSMPTASDLGVNKISAQMKSGYRDIANQKVLDAVEGEGILQKAQDADQRLNNQAAIENFNLNNELDEHRKAIMNNNIDSNRLWHNTSTGNKVLAGIGMLLSGIGSGLSGQPNMALAVIEKAIDRDVDAQKTDLEKHKALYSMGMDKMKLAHQSQAQRKLELWNGVKTQMEMMALKSGSAQAIAQAKIMGAEIDSKMLPYKQEELKWRMAQKLAGNSDPAAQGMLVRLTVPEKHQEQVFKELTQAQNHAKQTAIINASFNQADKDNTVGNRAVHGAGLFEPASVTRMKTAMMPYLKDAEGRINEQELERTDALIPRPGDLPEKIKQKRLGLQQFLAEKGSFPMLKAYGIRVPEMSAGGDEGIPEYPAATNGK